MSQISNTKRIAKNTLMLYFRQILILLVSLYTVRVVLNTLGAEDYGIYNVVAGVVTMFSFLSGAMATASQRYFSFALGKNDYELLKKTFSVTFQIYILIAFIVILFAETLGLWFVNSKLVIPHERMTAANWIYQAAIVSFLFTLITTPYMASIIAHEDMNIYALVSIIEVVLKLTIVFLLKIFTFDKLISYGILLTVVTIINTTLYRGFCHKKYDECKVRFEKDKALFKEIVSYSGWNLIGAISGVLKNQGLNIILNQFFGPLINAARAVALQINQAVNSFSQNFSSATKPQIVKTYALKDYNSLFTLLCRSCKFTFFLMFVFVVPLILNLEFVLNLWLKNYADKTLILTKLILMESLIESVSYPMSTANQATGKIKKYQIFLGVVNSLNLPISYVLLKLNFPVESVFITGIILMVVMTLIRFGFLKQIDNINLFDFAKKVFVPILLISGIIILIFSFLSCSPTSFSKFIKNVIFQVIVIVLAIYVIGLSKNEKKLISNFMMKKLRRK